MKSCVVFLFAVLVAFVAHAESAVTPLRDPTRPPDWQGSLDVPGVGAENALRLEAVKRVRQGRTIAVINGTQLHVGQEIRGLRLVSITEEMVILEGPEGRQELRLTPTVERPVRGKAPVGGK